MIQPYPGYKRFTLDSDTKGLKIEKIEEDILHKSNQKRVEVTTVAWDKTDFKTKNCY